MAFQTGTVANLNDLLDAFATFLLGAGWTIDGNWREPMVMSIGSISGPGGTVDNFIWRWARRLHAHKGTKFISLQDFYISKDLYYGTQGGVALSDGPGICGSISTSINAQPVDDVNLATYSSGPPSLFATFAQPGSPTSVNAITRTVIMPLPTVTSQPSGDYHPPTGGMNDNGIVGLPAPFGPNAGAPSPCPYWFMSDASGDNVIMVVLRGGDLPYISKTPYLYFGSVTKGGAWPGGNYIGACHGNNFAFVPADHFRANRWGPPGAMSDGSSCHSLLEIEIDTFVGAHRYAGMSTIADNNIRTGRTFSSSAVLRPKNELGDPTSDVGGLEQNGIHYGITRTRKSSLAQAAPLLPIYWVAKRDNGLFSLLGVVENIYQAHTYGFAPGTEWVDRNGNTYVVFDDFAVLKVP